MTRKDYVAIAEAIEVSNGGPFNIENDGSDYANDLFGVWAESLLIVARNIADVMQADNPRFDRNRFLKACGVA